MIEVFPISHQYKNSWIFYFEDNPTFNFYMKGLNLPFLKLDHINKETTGQKFYSKPTFPDTFSIEVYESLDFKTFDYFKAWQDQIYNSLTGTFNVGSFNKTAIFMFTSNFSATPVKTFSQDLKLLGFEELTLDYESGDPLTYSISFAINDTTIS
jgi:hypothetical protein